MRLTKRPRPTAAGVVVALAAVELGAFPLGRPSMLGLQGFSGTSAVLLAAALLGCAVHLWTRPASAAWSGATAIFLGLLSYPLANLGGFLIGMLLALLGGSLALAWQPVQDDAPPAPAGG
ncbi:DUF6114 domain-containing protein [Streptomyces aureocirculatus]|uniref:DUF6114 domain-containing protein n=1 Tax=Streptomyces aureocirculatus TaxID=67275 RepID=UPI00056CF63E|nr:DUF6114 domain-containing protein [Streptomyces aureocirculatus]